MWNQVKKQFRKQRLEEEERMKKSEALRRIIALQGHLNQQVCLYICIFIYLFMYVYTHLHICIYTC